MNEHKLPTYFVAHLADGTTLDEREGAMFRDVPVTVAEGLESFEVYYNGHHAEVDLATGIVLVDDAPYVTQLEHPADSELRLLYYKTKVGLMETAMPNVPVSLTLGWLYDGDGSEVTFAVRVYPDTSTLAAFVGGVPYAAHVPHVGSPEAIDGIAKADEPYLKHLG